MTNKEIKILERVFQTEVDNALDMSVSYIAQVGKSQVVKKLVRDGYLQPAEQILSGRFPVTIRGHILTELGRITYCTEAK